MKKLLFTAIAACFLFVSSCGTILKWDQVSKPHSGQIDLAVVSLDTAGLFFFVVPGIIFFTVDYYTGTLFLPKA